MTRHEMKGLLTVVKNVQLKSISTAEKALKFFESRLEKEGFDDVHYDEEFINLIVATRDSELSVADSNEI